MKTVMSQQSKRSRRVDARRARERDRGLMLGCALTCIIGIVAILLVTILVR